MTDIVEDSGVEEPVGDNSVRASLEASWEELSKSEEPTAAAAAGTEPEPKAAEATVETEPAPAAAVEDQPPAALTGEAKAKWASCPPEWRAEISRLALDSAKAAGKYGEDAKFAQSIREQFQPYRALMQQYNASEAATVGSALRSIATLAAGTPEQKAAEVRAICQAYGVDPAALGTPPAVNPELSPLVNEITGLRETVSSLTAGQQEFYRQQADADIKQFLASGDKPHFELVRGRMSQLMANGSAVTLADAYEQAVMLVPEAREAYLNAEIEKRRASAAEAANQARQAAVSQRGQPLSGHMPAREPDTVRASLEKAWDELAS